MIKEKTILLERGIKLVTNWCKLQGIDLPKITPTERDKWYVPACGYYRPRSGINICPTLCSGYGRASRNWSWPGYVVDRTPYGVVAHELGHHIDWLLSPNKATYYGDFSHILHAQAREPPITSYAPNNAEWFAEIFRLFLTNPDLLAQIRPRTFELLTSEKIGLKIRTPRNWEDVLVSNDAPERTINAARNKINKAEFGR